MLDFMYGLRSPENKLRIDQVEGRTADPGIGGGRGYRATKRVFDILTSLAAMPFVALIGFVLFCINPFWNDGPLLFVQQRMGKDGKAFKAYKFRTMRPAERIKRGPNDPLEADRITPLGATLRRTRIDEFPQFVNVLRGDMSIIGPRPDFWDHAVHYVDIVPGYERRHVVRPGITGLAQVDAGYAEGIVATRLKTRYDLVYVRRRSLRIDAYICWRTLVVVATGFGAR